VSSACRVDEVSADSFSHQYLGRVSFQEARAFQETLVEARLAGACADTFIYAEHPPTLSLGMRTQSSDLVLSKDDFRRQGIEVVSTNRGGGPTYHGPGQLLIYPVLSLRDRQMGVRDFVYCGLQAIAEALPVPAEVSLSPTGVWLRSRGADAELEKIAAVGLKIVHGVGNHGFSVNVNIDLEPYSFFHPCGLQQSVTHLAAHVHDELSVEDFLPRVRRSFEAMFLKA